MLEEPIQPIDMPECQIVGIAFPCSITLEIAQMGILNLEENIRKRAHLARLRSSVSIHVQIYQDLHQTAFIRRLQVHKLDCLLNP